jgi:tetratricopeptide (TPR) repeat protein
MAEKVSVDERESIDRIAVSAMLEETDVSQWAPPTGPNRVVRKFKRLWAGTLVFLKSLDDARGHVVSFFVVLIAIALVVATGRAVLENAIVVEPISVPKNLQEDGYSGVVVAQRLIDQAQAISRTARTRKERARFGSEADYSSLAAIQVPSSGLSMRSAVSMIRDLMGYPERQISGEITIKRPKDPKEAAKYVLLLRRGPTARLSDKPAEAEGVEEIIRLSALAIVEEFDPVVAASYCYELHDWPQLDRMAKRLMASDDRNVRKWGHLFAGLRSYEAPNRSSVAQDKDKAKISFEQAIALDPKFVAAYVDLGMVLENLRSYREAKQNYDIAITLDPKFAPAFAGRGRTYNGLGDYDRAIKDFDQAIELDRNYTLAFANRGIAYAEKGQYDRAIENYDEALRLDPNDGVAFNNRGNAYQDKRQFDQAIENYNKAIGLNPRDVVAHINRGITYRKMGQYDQALQDHSRAIALNPNNADAFSDLCLDKAILGQLESAIADCNESLRLRPNHADTLDRRGFASLKLEQIDMAIQYYDAALKIDPTSPFSLFGRGVAKRRKGDAAGGDADIRAATAIRADIADYMAALGVRSQ